MHIKGYCCERETAEYMKLTNKIKQISKSMPRRQRLAGQPLLSGAPPAGQPVARLPSVRRRRRRVWRRPASDHLPTLAR